MAQPSELGGSRPPTRIPAIGRTPTVAPPSTPRQVRQGDYIITYSPTGSILSRQYSPVTRSTQTGNRAESQVVNNSNYARAQAFVDRYQAPKQTTAGLFAGSPGQKSSGGGSVLGQVGNMAQNSFDVYPATSGSGSTGGGASPGGSNNPSANSGVTYTGPFAGISDKQADYMVANPLAIAERVFGLDMANNPTIAALLGPVLEAAQQPYIAPLLNPGMSGVQGFDQNGELNFAADLLRQYTTPGGSFLSPTVGLRNIQQAMGDPNSALNAVLSSMMGDGASGAGTQFTFFQDLMAPLLNLGTGAWGSGIFDAIGYDAYNKYMLNQAKTPGLPKQDMLSALMGAYGFPATLK